MKKTFYFTIILALLLSSTRVFAQYVTIPDANFATYLKGVIPSAMSGNQMDTTSPVVTSLTRIDVENMGIKDITGVQYFSSLITLDCGNGLPSTDSNKLTSLPNLPSTLDSLICGNNQLTSLPALPSNLRVLKCYLNHLTNLPTLPSSLKELDCYSNQIDSLPTLPTNITILQCQTNQITSIPILPGTITYFRCESNKLTSIPPLPSVLTTFYCGYNQITSLPVLPSGLIALECDNDLLSSLPVLPITLTGLDCAGNQLDTLPSLPSALGHLGCSNNQLTRLPALPSKITYILCAQNKLDSLPALPVALQTLWCDHNQLTSVPALPSGLTDFICDYNHLTSIPTLPAGLSLFWCDHNQLTSLPVLTNSLTEFLCDTNNISCFPVFPSCLNTAKYFDISGNPFTCLPNYVAKMDLTTLSYPLCAIINPNGCPPAYGVVGFTYRDIDSNCIKDSTDHSLINVPINVYNSSSTLVGQTYTALNGVYDFPISVGTYTVSVDTVGMPFQVQCVHPGVDSTVKITLLDTNVNFSLTCKSGFDVGVQSVMANGIIFPGNNHILSVIAGDMSQWYNLNCAKGDSGTVQIVVSGPVTYAGTTSLALTPLVSGNTYKYSIPDFGSINNPTAFGLLFNTDTTAKAGDTICVSVTVTPLADNNPGNNTYQYCYTVVASYDPNVKTVWPVNVLPGYSDWFTYTIHFQNTGTAAANNILIRDTLDKNLDVSTFQLINYSHQNTVHVSNNILTVGFPNINLADTATSLAGSTGFVQYRIKPKAGLPVGTVIKNTGYIYFDHNPAVITNTTQNVFEYPASVNTITEPGTLNVFPNPNSGEFTILLQGIQGKCSVLLYNDIGEMVYKLNLINGNTQISIPNKSQGLYLYRIITEKGQLLGSGKLVIE